MIKHLEEKRLAYYASRADQAFWGKHWKSLISLDQFRDAERGRLGWFEEPFIKYLPKQGRILEAGCGTGHYVLALRNRGYDVEGVEWSKATVRAVRELFPSLPVRLGDARQLPVRDGYYAGYISLGVIEHRRDGPLPFLKEAMRVLRRGGVAFISAPQVNWLRRLKSVIGFYRGSLKGKQFYQYAFTEQELNEIVLGVGFKILDHFRYDAYKTVRDEIPFLRVPIGLLASRLFSGSLVHPYSQIKRPLSHQVYRRRPTWLTMLDGSLGHMTMVIAKKP